MMHYHAGILSKPMETPPNHTRACAEHTLPLLPAFYFHVTLFFTAKPNLFIFRFLFVFLQVLQSPHFPFMPSDKANLYLSKLGPGARLFRRFESSGATHVREVTPKSTMDSLQDFGDDSSSVGGKVVGSGASCTAPRGLPSDTVATGIVRSGASCTAPHLPFDPAASGIVGEAVASCTATRIPPDASNVDAFALGTAPRLPSASATSDVDVSKAPPSATVTSSDLPGTGIRPNLPTGLTPNFSGIRPNIPPVSGLSPNIPIFSGIRPNAPFPFAAAPQSSFPGSGTQPSLPSVGIQPNFSTFDAGQVSSLPVPVPLSAVPQNPFPGILPSSSTPQGLAVNPSILGQLASILSLAAHAAPQTASASPPTFSAAPLAPTAPFAAHPLTATQLPVEASSSSFPLHASPALDAPVPVLSPHPPPGSSQASSVADSDVADADDLPPSKRGAFTIREAIPLLLDNFPEMAGSSTPVEDTGRSLSDMALGLSSIESERQTLKESGFVSEALNQAMSAVRGSKSNARGGVSAENVPKYPSALQCGRFLPTDRHTIYNSIVDRHSIPDGPLKASSEDLSLIPEGRRADKRAISIPDNIAADFEESARRSLIAVSTLDSFMAGFIKSVRHPDSPRSEFQLRDEMDPECLAAFASASVSVMQHLASHLAKLHTNLRLARKDALLSSSALNKDVCASLRAAPPDPDGSFFGACASSSIEHEAKLRRDMHFLQPQKQNRQSAPRPERSDRSSFGPPPRRQPYSKVRVQPKQRSQSDRFRPYPSQDSDKYPRGKGGKSRLSRKGGHPQ